MGRCSGSYCVVDVVVVVFSGCLGFLFLGVVYFVLFLLLGCFCFGWGFFFPSFFFLPSLLPGDSISSPGLDAKVLSNVTDEDHAEMRLLALLKQT